eukprot:scaffold111330_cov51-Phaeocystis_antarctica.AAC.1
MVGSDAPDQRAALHLHELLARGGRVHGMHAAHRAWHPGTPSGAQAPQARSGQPGSRGLSAEPPKPRRPGLGRMAGGRRATRGAAAWLRRFVRRHAATRARVPGLPARVPLAQGDASPHARARPGDPHRDAVPAAVRASLSPSPGPSPGPGPSPDPGPSPNPNPNSEPGPNPNSNPLLTLQGGGKTTICDCLELLANSE